MSNILCLETSTTNCSVALSRDGEIISIKEDNNREYSHAERLHVYMEEVLKDANLNNQELDAIAVSKGPGSYTGLRIGVSAAKGLCFALDLPLISIPTLGSLSRQVSTPSKYIIPMLDARRMEVYSAVFDSQYNVIRETKAEILTEDSFSEYLEKGNTTFIGNGVSKWQALCTHPNALFIPEALPSAKQMASLSEEKFKANQFEDVAYFEPYYLKDFKAG